jgi:hypothetical protein
MAIATFVKKARKNFKDDGIKKGDSYYHWKFRYGGIHRSKTKPRASQLTQSEFLSSVFSIEESFSDLSIDQGFDAVKETIEQAAEELRELGDETEDKISNMPDSLQQSETADLLQSRADDVRQMADDLDAIDLDDDETATAEERAEHLQTIIDEAQGVSYSGD